MRWLARRVWFWQRPESQALDTANFLKGGGPHKLPRFPPVARFVPLQLGRVSVSSPSVAWAWWARRFWSLGPWGQTRFLWRSVWQERTCPLHSSFVGHLFCIWDGLLLASRTYAGQPRETPLQWRTETGWWHKPDSARARETRVPHLLGLWPQRFPLKPVDVALPRGAKRKLYRNCQWGHALALASPETSGRGWPHRAGAVPGSAPARTLWFTVLLRVHTFGNWARASIHVSGLMDPERPALGGTPNGYGRNIALDRRSHTFFFLLMWNGQCHFRINGRPLVTLRWDSDPQHLGLLRARWGSHSARTPMIARRLPMEQRSNLWIRALAKVPALLNWHQVVRTGLGGSRCVFLPAWVCAQARPERHIKSQGDHLCWTRSTTAATTAPKTTVQRRNGFCGIETRRVLAPWELDDSSTVPWPNQQCHYMWSQLKM